ncbi:BirA family transcriptional regulator, biotin operon repressor / biotin-[acetyl-CoA-carboxylase] ligase [Saccharicrinis carchari]|uniref:biotin--[biotin carboxyl-carrier protein] ligase n=1 Tax=Saccharicrinis carchari TaxID=1168039 RepID=A0A521EU25_SACCC|nr:biotin--[acetyl-CoA-carboxylase] ligase [Saccharicrinis carchari]SMO87397.1 BirA family transcriptional regulator, biotin operon repressor / biotin-[acetyl-CoA-carboxylase] ligase [Saccharicrinis carchari]
MSNIKYFNILRFPALASTNQTLKSLHQTDPMEEYTVVVCDSQTAGKGQAGNHWESEAGKNLTFSILLKPAYVQIQDQFLISKAVSLGILDALKTYSSGFTIKWPNDIYYQDKKVGGILIENALYQNRIGTSVVGIGLNVNQTVFVSDAPNPVSLKAIRGKALDPGKLLNQILPNIVKYLDTLRTAGPDSVNRLYLAQLYRKNGLYCYRDENGEFKARITGINDYGHMLLKTDEGQRRSYAFKEVEFVMRD